MANEDAYPPEIELDVDSKSLECDDDGLGIPETEAEETLLAGLASPGEIIISEGLDVKNPNAWGEDQTIRAGLLRHICLNPELYQLDAEGIAIGGARIAGVLNFKNATLPPLRIDGSRFTAAPNLILAKAAHLAFDGSFLVGIDADGLAVKNGLFLRGVTVNGETRLLGAHIGGNLECNNATFDHQDGTALNADRLTVTGYLFLRQATISSGCNLLGAHIGGNLECNSATFSHPGATAFTADRLTVAGDLFLHQATVKGEFRLLGAKIAANLECNNATFDHQDGTAFYADRLTVKGGLFLRHVTVNGVCRLLGANIDGNLECIKAIFDQKNGHAFIAGRLVVGGRFFWQNFQTPPNGHVQLRHAQVGDFFDDASGWPGPGKLHLDGLTYENWGEYEPARSLCKWLKLQPQTYPHTGAPAYWPQPYEQLAKTYRNAGHERDSRIISIAKQDARRDYLRRMAKYDGDPRYGRRVWLWFLDWSAGYGYAPWRALVLLAFFWTIGTTFFELGYVGGHVLPAKDRAYMQTCYRHYDAENCGPHWRNHSTHPSYLPPELEPGVRYGLPHDYVTFFAPAYAFDVLIPILDLSQEDHWEPKTGWVRAYMWLHIIAGWVFTTIAVAGFTGLIKKDD